VTRPKPTRHKPTQHDTGKPKPGPGPRLVSSGDGCGSRVEAEVDIQGVLFDALQRFLRTEFGLHPEDAKLEATTFMRRYLLMEDGVSDAAAAAQMAVERATVAWRKKVRR
jgi:hypothetical protein